MNKEYCVLGFGWGMDIAVLEFVRTYTGYWAEIYDSVGSTNLVDSAPRKIGHPQEGNVPFLKHTDKNVIEDGQPTSI